MTLLYYVLEHAHVQNCTQLNTKQRRAERNAPRGAVCIAVLLNYLLRRDFIRHRYEAENVYQGL